MFKQTRKLATTAAVVLSIGLGSLAATSTPARAEGAEAAAVIGGLIALFALSRALDNDNDNDNRVEQVQRNAGRHFGHNNRIIEPFNQRRLVAPDRCRREFQTRNGTFRGYNRRCMQNNVRNAHLLPDNCLRQVRTERGIRNFYGGRCLHRNGWVRQ
ncbi:MAG: hypothetical protein AAF376_00250 [Pseudomonadota bacterium]